MTAGPREQYISAVRNKGGNRDGAVVRAVASHQCGPGSIPGLGVICGLNLLLVLVLAPRVFSGYSSFPPSSKTNISKFQFDLEFVERLNMSPWLGRLGNHSLRFRRKIKYLVSGRVFCNRSLCSYSVVLPLKKNSF